MRCAPGLLALCLGCGWVAGCNEDTVHPGFYGELKPPRNELAPREASASDGQTTDRPEQFRADLRGTGTAGAGGLVDPEPAAGTEAERCDLRGRWLVTLHFVTDALGQQQTAHAWLYYEIERGEDGGLTVARGLHCGDEAVAVGAFAVQADFRSSRSATTAKVSYAGQPVRSTPTSGGCEIQLARRYTVRGATTPYYTDPSIPLPGVDQPASGGRPGWEDWDEDGQPGITSLVSGTVNGKIFMSPRIWYEISGEVPEVASAFLVSLDWNQETNLLAFDGSPLLLTQGVRAADRKLHFAQFARLSPEQAIGDEQAVCAAVVELAPTLTPTASAI